MSCIFFVHIVKDILNGLHMDSDPIKVATLR